MVWVADSARPNQSYTIRCQSARSSRGLRAGAHLRSWHTKKHSQRTGPTQLLIRECHKGGDTSPLWQQFPVLTVALVFGDNHTCLMCLEELGGAALIATASAHRRMHVPQGKQSSSQRFRDLSGCTLSWDDTTLDTACSRCSVRK